MTVQNLFTDTLIYSATFDNVGNYLLSFGV